MPFMLPKDTYCGLNYERLWKPQQGYWCFSRKSVEGILLHEETLIQIAYFL